MFAALLALALFPATQPPDIHVTQVTTTTYAAPLPPAPAAAILRRLGMPEEGLQPIEYDAEEVPSIDFAVEWEDVWYALRAALTEYRIFERLQAWPALVAILVIGAGISFVIKMSTRPPEI